MSYALIEQQTGNVVEDFLDEEEALVFVEAEMTPTDRWALVEFGRFPSDNRFIAEGKALRDKAMGITPDAITIATEES